MDGIEPPVCTTECIASRNTAPGIGSMPKTKGSKSTMPSLPPRPGSAPKKAPIGIASSISMTSCGTVSRLNSVDAATSICMNVSPEAASVSRSPLFLLRRCRLLEQSHGFRRLRERLLDTRFHFLPGARDDRNVERPCFGLKLRIVHRPVMCLSQDCELVRRNARRPGGQTPEIGKRFEQPEKLPAIGVGHIAAGL